MAEPTFIDFSILLDILRKVVTKSEGGIRRTLGIMLRVGVECCCEDAIVRLRLRRCKVHYASGFDASDGIEETVSIRMAYSRKATAAKSRRTISYATVCNGWDHDFILIGTATDATCFRAYMICQQHDGGCSTLILPPWRELQRVD